MVVDEPLLLATVWLDAPDGDSAANSSAGLSPHAELAEPVAFPEPSSCEASDCSPDGSACSANKAWRVCGPNCGVLAELAAVPDDEADDEETPDEEEAPDEAAVC